MNNKLKQKDMKLSAALEYEKLREDETAWNKVILHRDGKFYHAYDWSAWIIKMYVCTEAFQLSTEI